MLKPILSFLLISSLFISSCGGEKKEKEDKKEEKKEETSQLNLSDKGIMANRLADISIIGMVSEVKCVGSIKKLLSAMVGVTDFEMNFNSTNDVNHAMVKYDVNIINDQEMVNAIEKLNDGAYKVGEIEIKKLEEKSISAKKKTEEKEITFTTSPSSGSGGFALPNILDVFNIL
jgi:copper chaperone CopZ